VSDDAFLALLGVVAVVAIAAGVAGVVFVNYVIGRNYAAQATALAPILATEEILFSENDVRTRMRWIAPLAVALQWPRVNVRVTSRAIYLVQYRILFGWHMAQPILAMALAPRSLAPEARPHVHEAFLDLPPRADDDAVVLEGKLGRQRFSMRIFVRDPSAFVRALATPRRSAGPT
jgi:hypothetical protein